MMPCIGLDINYAEVVGIGIGMIYTVHAHQSHYKIRTNQPYLWH